MEKDSWDLGLAKKVYICTSIYGNMSGKQGQYFWRAWEERGLTDIMGPV